MARCETEANWSESLFVPAGAPSGRTKFSTHAAAAPRVCRRPCLGVPTPPQPGMLLLCYNRSHYTVIVCRCTAIASHEIGIILRSCPKNCAACDNQPPCRTPITNARILRLHTLECSKHVRMSYARTFFVFHNEVAPLSVLVVLGALGLLLLVLLLLTWRRDRGEEEQ